MRKNLWAIIGAGIAGFAGGVILKKGEDAKPMKLNDDKYMQYFWVLEQWMKLRESGGTVARYFLKHGYKRIGIYGVAQLGSHLIAELDRTEIEVVYGIDRRAELIYTGIPVYGLKDAWEEVDVIVVTPIYDYHNIEKKLKSKCDYMVISLETVIEESMEENLI